MKYTIRLDHPAVQQYIEGSLKHAEHKVKLARENLEHVKRKSLWRRFAAYLIGARNGTIKGCELALAHALDDQDEVKTMALVSKITGTAVSIDADLLQELRHYMELSDIYQRGGI